VKDNNSALKLFFKWVIGFFERNMKKYRLNVFKFRYRVNNNTPCWHILSTNRRFLFSYARQTLYRLLVRHIMWTTLANDLWTVNFYHHCPLFLILTGRTKLRNAILTSRWEEKARQADAKMDRWYQGLVKQISGRVFKVGERQATMETAGARNDLRPSVMRKETSNQASILTSITSGKCIYEPDILG